MLSNCYTYNKIGQPVHILGQRIEKLFNAELRKAGHGHLIRNIKKQPRCALGVLWGRRGGAEMGRRGVLGTAQRSRALAAALVGGGGLSACRVAPPGR